MGLWGERLRGHKLTFKGSFLSPICPLGTLNRGWGWDKIHYRLLPKLFVVVCWRSLRVNFLSPYFFCLFFFFFFFSFLLLLFFLFFLFHFLFRIIFIQNIIYFLDEENSGLVTCSMWLHSNGLFHRKNPKTQVTQDVENLGFLGILKKKHMEISGVN